MKRALASIIKIGNTYEISADENSKDYVEFIAGTPFGPKVKNSDTLSLLYSTQRMYSRRKGE